MSGSAVESRHYPVTVGAEHFKQRTCHWAAPAWEGRLKLLKFLQGCVSQETGQLCTASFSLLGGLKSIGLPAPLASRTRQAVPLLALTSFPLNRQPTGPQDGAFMSSLPPNPGARHPVTLVLGGARSGKSRFAQQRAEGTAGRILFLATATAGDDEMRAKIDRHRTDRPADWTTVEEPLHLPDALRQNSPGHSLALVDCLTLYASNLLETHDPEAHVGALIDLLTDPPLPIVLVSNEVGSGVVPEYELGRRYRDLLGQINQRVAAVASEVLLLVAGLPLTLKAGS